MASANIWAPTSFPLKSTFLPEYLVGRPDGITRASERHELGMYTVAEMRAAMEDAGLRVSHDAEGLSGRGVYIGIKG